ncbi:hypothetical protein [Plantactinospora sp. KBS50]|uniref:hypothetical protein n=1 Tax=Plantactinospora sp. KBS50 TaxID=2024580 RepID=UPI001E5F43B9|nr:hypothetical protein [Plantactinospora sp. KBS50]
MAEPSSPLPHQPGAISLFFVIKAGVFAAAFWVWLVVLMVQGGAASGLHLFVASGAITTTGVSVLLGVRLAIQRNAAVRHAELKRLLVDISWNAFAAAGSAEEADATVVPFRGFDTPTPRRGRGEKNDLERRR